MRLSGVVASLLAAAFCGGAFAQRPVPPLKVWDLKGGAYVVEGGSGANTGFVVTPKGAVTIDAKTNPESAKGFLAVVAQTTSNPLTNIILTHSDSDHVNGLPGFPKGLPIWAHEECKKEMQAVTGARAMPAEYLPAKTSAGNQTLNIDGVRIDLLYFGRAHTSGDIVVYLPAQKVAYTGDLINMDMTDILIHAHKGGTPAGWLKAMAELAAIDADAFVPGHGTSPVTREVIRKKLAAAQEKYDRVKALVAQGQSLAEVRKALGEAEPGPNDRYPTFTQVSYNELTKK